MRESSRQLVKSRFGSVLMMAATGMPLTPMKSAY
ncbi:hypothetical protein BV96_00486 [Sphingomonas paucimobilis]|nr:hypothetical protein BV96_00486 [Sphingomonas paucimobilis]